MREGGTWPEPDPELVYTYVQQSNEILLVL